jgi:xanthine dehydrogenase YagT iron-sulfur-binding subunit
MSTDDSLSGSVTFPETSADGQDADELFLPVGGAQITLHINGKRRAVHIEPWVTLLDALRERLGLTGTHKGCDHGQCGACTVLVDGRRVLSCLSLACALDDQAVTTIEGLAVGDELHPLQTAFVRHDAYQCGYCTSGQIMSALGLLSDGYVGSDAEIREEMSGNLCRCGAYANIVAAIREVAKSGSVAVGEGSGFGPEDMPSNLRPGAGVEQR